MTLDNTIFGLIIGGIFSIIVAVIGVVSGIMGMLQANRALSQQKVKQDIEVAAIVKEISLDLLSPLETRIRSLEAEKVNWQLERAILIRQIQDRDAIILDLRSITSKLVGGITILIDQLHSAKIPPQFELSNDMLEELKRHVSK